MGLFGHGDDEKEAQDQQRYDEAQRKMLEARERQAQQQAAAHPTTAPAAQSTSPASAQPSAAPAAPVGGRPVPSTPTSVSNSPAADGSFESYTVRAGDTLTGIAHHFYGKASAWKRIQEANPGKVTDPDRIRVGEVLRIPKDGGHQSLA